VAGSESQRVSEEVVKHMLLFDPFARFDMLAGARRPGFLPAVDVAVSENDLVLTMDLPGMTPDDLDVQILEEELVVSGERPRPELTEGSGWAHAERGFGRFERRIRLPQGIDPDAVTASMDHGVLSLIVPKPERSKPRRLEISTGSEQAALTA
jgi:HSP20 family protein